MKKIIYPIVALLLLGAILISTSGCDEDNILNTSGLQYFYFDFKTVRADYDLQTLRSTLISPPSTFTTGAVEFNNLNKDSLITFSAAHEVNIYGTPGSSTSSIDIWMTHTPVEEKNWVSQVRIMVQGPFEVGETYTEATNEQNYTELIFYDEGAQDPNVYSTNVGDDTFFELTITELNTTTRQIEGTLIFALRHEDDPLGSLPYVGFGGEFKYTYRVP